MSNTTVEKKSTANPWSSSLDKLKEWDPEGAALLLKAGTNEWRSGLIPLREVELISLALECASPNLDEAETRRHVRAALAAGATREEILHVIECVFALAVRSCGLGASILVEEMEAAGVTAAGTAKTPPSIRDEKRDMGRLSSMWASVFRAFAFLDR